MILALPHGTALCTKYSWPLIHYYLITTEYLSFRLN